MSGSVLRFFFIQVNSKKGAMCKDAIIVEGALRECGEVRLKIGRLEDLLQLLILL